MHSNASPFMLWLSVDPCHCGYFINLEKGSPQPKKCVFKFWTHFAIFSTKHLGNFVDVFFQVLIRKKIADFSENKAKMVMWHNGKNKPLVPRDSHKIIFKNKLCLIFLDFCCSQCVLQIYSQQHLTLSHMLCPILSSYKSYHFYV